ncbi:hypothetical protein [cf. Phormidesmis sp. LEGE 11477]|uniref:hypothetical protein n=1 Tax=cf. Phormidesmis sp. LEGE 11477 TaxID=1828680 RepID=UPI00187ED75C|nr:hypothetical protein [cf. Phormidesmis sp. LEGE 11477]MBE9061067.1 hypothetical protein [cf. Phormidesmis sp. LEGE 11477]
MFRLTIIACFIITCFVTLTACGQNSTIRSRASQVSVYQIKGDRTERTASVSAILNENVAPPTAILDANFLQQQLGDGEFGPSDYQTFYFVEVASQDIAQWIQLLTPLTPSPNYIAPAQPIDWWITRDDFTTLQFYEPSALFGETHGWVGVSAQTGRLYIFTFTM